jgi:hypothetical protein
MFFLIILLILLFGGGGFYGYRSGYYGPRGMGLMSILFVVLLICFMLGGFGSGMMGGYGHGMYFR